MIRMAKQEEKVQEKGSFMCASCSTEFVGNACPDCGNKAGNVRLSKDGIDQQLHSKKVLFSGLEDLKSTDVSEMDLMKRKAAMAQIEEFDDNMRESYVIKSEIKKSELELERMKRESALQETKAALESGRPVASHPPQTGYSSNQYPQDNGSGVPFMNMGMNPQTAFMSQLMKMDKEKRQEFLNQLSDADPQALSAMSSMLYPAPPAMMPGYGSSPNMQAMGGYPSWMQQMWMSQMGQQQQQHPPQTDPTETALAMMSTMFDLMNKMKPQTDDSIKETLKEIREENRELRQRLDTRGPGPSSNDTYKPVLEELASLRNQINNSSSRRGISDSISEISDLVTGLEKMGLINKPGSVGKSTDDEIKLKRLEHEIKKDDRVLDIENKKIEADKAKASMAQNLMTAMFQRSMQKKEEGKLPTLSRSNTGISSGSTSPVSSRLLKKEDVISEYSSDSGKIQETRGVKSSTVS